MSKKNILAIVVALILLILSPLILFPDKAHLAFYLGKEFFSKKPADGVPVLVYHHLLKEEENRHKDNSGIINVESFEEQMAYLHKEGYRTLTLEELEAYVKGEIKVPNKSVVITFDDGYKSNYIYAYPILKKYNFKAAIFLITSTLTEETVDFDPYALQYLSWEEIEKSKDVFEFASHSHDLHHLDEEKISYVLSQDQETVIEDLKYTLETLESPYFAYPYGHYNEERIELLKEIGFRMAVTVEEGYVQPGDDLFTLKRRMISPWVDDLGFKKKLGR